MSGGRSLMATKYRLSIDLKDWQAPDLDTVVHAMKYTAKEPLLHDKTQAVKVHYLLKK
jgi:hypothetical protein